MSKSVLLVHGGHAGAWEWEVVITELEKRGLAATAIDMPSREPGYNLLDDENAVRDALSNFQGSVVLVGHSYSGAVITGASAGNDKVSHLVYVAAALPTEGQSVASSLAGEPQAEVPVLDSTDDWSVLERDAARTLLYNDASNEQFESVFPFLGGLSYRVMTTLPSGYGWKEHPSTYVACTLDQSFPIEAQRRFASHTTTFVELEAGHSPMLTKPVEVAEAIAAVTQ